MWAAFLVSNRPQARRTATRLTNDKERKSIPDRTLRTSGSGLYPRDGRRCRRASLSRLPLIDGSRWRIWPGDLATTLRWLPTTELQVVAIDHEFYSHVLIDQSDGSQVGVIQAGAEWPAKQVQRHLKKG